PVLASDTNQPRSGETQYSPARSAGKKHTKFSKPASAGDTSAKRPSINLHRLPCHPLAPKPAGPLDRTLADEGIVVTNCLFHPPRHRRHIIHIHQKPGIAHDLAHRRSMMR